MAQSGMLLSEILPESPSRAGNYRFVKWQDAYGNEVSTSSAITGDISLTAVFEAYDTVPVTFVCQGETVAEVNAMIGEPIGDQLPAAPSIEGKYFDGWFAVSSGFVTASTSFTEETTAYAALRDLLQVEFWDCSGTQPEHMETVSVPDGNALGPDLPAVPGKTGYTASWAYHDDQTTAFTGETPVTASVRIDSVYDKIVYTVTFKDADGGVVATQTTDIDAGFAVVNPPEVPVKKNHTGKWVIEGTDTEFKPGTVVTGDTVIVPSYEQNVYVVTFMNGSAVHDTMDVYSGQTLTLPAEPVQTGKSFVGWFDQEEGGTQYTAASEVSDNLTLYARFTDNVRVRFIVRDEQNEIIQDQSQYFVELPAGTTVGTLPENPFREGWSFVRWEDEAGNEITADTVVEADVTATAVFEKILTYELTVNYYYLVNENDPSSRVDIASRTVNATQSGMPVWITSPASAVASEITGEPLYYPTVSEVSAIAEDFTFNEVTGKYELTVEVQYKDTDSEYVVVYYLKNLNGQGYTEIGTRKTVKAVLHSSIAPEVSTEFDAYAEFERRDEGELTATNQQFGVYYTRKNFTVSYDSNGGSYVEAASLPYGSSYTLTAGAQAPTRVGYSFAGWYTGAPGEDGVPTGDPITSISELTEDTTVYAKWTGDPVNYTVIFLKEQVGSSDYAVDGQPATMTGTTGSTVTASNPSHYPQHTAPNGYELDTEMNTAEQVVIAADGSSVLLVYYKLIRYTFVFNANGGTVTMGGRDYTGSSYVVNDIVVGQDVKTVWPSSSNEIHRDGRGFGGWSDNHHNWLQLTKVQQIDYEYFEGTNNNHVVTWTAQCNYTNHNRNAEYWLQQPDGTWAVAPEYTQIGVNTDGLSAKEIDGYTQHNGDASAPNGYQGDAQNATVTAITVIPEHDETYTTVEDTDRGETWTDGGGNEWTFKDTETQTFTTTQNTDNGNTWNDGTYDWELTGTDQATNTQYRDRGQTYTDWSGVTWTLDHTVPHWGYTEYVYVRTVYNYERTETYYNYERTETIPEQTITATNTGYTYRFYYDRAKYDIKFYEGSTLLHTDEDVFYEADISGYSWTPSASIDPAKAGYEWGGWHTDSALTSDAYSFSGKTMPGSDLLLYAKWIAPTFTMTFDTQGGEGSFPAQTKSANQTFDKPNANPTKENYTFSGWYTGPDDSAALYDWNKPATEDVTVYAHYKQDTLSYVAHYVKEDTGEKLLDDKTVSDPTFVVGTTKTEIAPTITGFLPDAGEKSVTLAFGEDANVITFYYGTQQDELTYTVEYVLASDHSVHVAESQTITVPGTTTVVQATPVDANKAYMEQQGYSAAILAEDYHPTEDRKELSLGSDASANVITFEYVPYEKKKITVNYLDMDGVPIQPAVTENVSRGDTFTVQTKPQEEGWLYHHAVEEENGSAGSAAQGSYFVQDSEELVIKIFYYQRRLTIAANNKAKVYDGTALESSTVVADGDFTVTGLNRGEQILSIGFDGSQTEVGSSATTPMNAVVTDPDGKVLSSEYYNTVYIPGTLTVTKAIVYVNIYPDRYTTNAVTREPNLYTGEYYEPGFTNPTKPNPEDYVTISNEQFSDEYLDAIWYVLTHHEPGGKVLIRQKDASPTPYEIPGSVMEGWIRDGLPDMMANSNFDIHLYVRECRLVINPAPLTVTTESAEKVYDGEELTEPTATITGLVNGETATVTATGTQTEVGTSQNIYAEIEWGTADPKNYTVTDSLGTLTVTRKDLTITVKNRTLPYNGEEQEGYRI